MNLSPNFTLEEMTVSQTASRLGIYNTPSSAIVEELKRTCGLLELVRTALGDHPIVVTSGYRSVAVNRAVGGVGNSQHVLGQAADFIVPQVGTPREICKLIMKSGIKYDQLIWEFDDWVHISQSPNPRMAALTINSSGTELGIS
jgi:zinc D-Ala-D-Ala carboxypeptidase